MSLPSRALCKPNCWLLTPEEIYKVAATSQQPSFWWPLLTVELFQSLGFGIGFPAPRGVKCASELEDSKTVIAEPSVGQRGFWESGLISCALGQSGLVKWKISKLERNGTQLETKCSVQPGCCQTSEHRSCEAIRNPILEMFSSCFNRTLILHPPNARHFA